MPAIRSTRQTRTALQVTAPVNVRPAAERDIGQRIADALAAKCAPIAVKTSGKRLISDDHTAGRPSAHGGVNGHAD
jgi:hypothetical protein